MTIDNGIPPDWKLTKVESICDIRRGASPRPIQDPKWFADQGPGWVRIVDVTRSRRYLRQTVQSLSELGASKSVRVKSGDVIMSICATIGCPVIVDMDACIHDGFVLFDNLNENVDPEYLCHLLERETARFSGQGQKGTQANLNTSIVKRALLLIPPRAEQHGIVKVLASVDEAIERTRAVIDQTRKLKTALLQDLLTNGLPGRHTRWQTHKTAGRLPKCWSYVQLGEVATFQNGKAFPSSEYGIGNTRLIRPGNLHESGLVVWDDDHTTTLPDKHVTESSEYLVGGDELIMNLTAQSLEDDFLGRVCWTASGDGISLLNQRLARFRATGCSLRYLYWTFRGPVYRAHVNRLPTGSKVKHLYNGDLESFQVPLPKETEQNEISAALDAIETRELTGHLALEQLESTKAALSQALLTGNVRVPTKGGE